ncbi:Pogo transposable element derived with ZNF domain a [Balamuthia mandrillaris]
MEARQTNGEDQPQKDAAAEPTPNGWEEEPQQQQEEEGWSATTSFGGGGGGAAWDFGSDPEDEEDEEQDIQFLSSSSFESGSFYARLDEGEGLEEGEQQPYTGHYQPLPQQEEDENQQHDKEEEDEAAACPQLEAEACTEAEHEEKEQQEEAEEEAEGFGLPTQSFEPEEDLFTNGNNKKKGVWPLSSAPLTKEKEEKRVAKAYRRFEENYAAELGLQHHHHQPQQEGVGTTQEATGSLLAGEQVQSIKEAMKGFSLSYTPPWALNVPEHAWHQFLCNALNPGHTSSPNGIAMASSPSSSPSSSDEAEEACPSNNNRNEA